MSNIVISVKNLNKVYRLYNKRSDRVKEMLLPWKRQHTVFNALSDVSFSVEKGKHLGIIGTNGAGKSTLLQIITGVLAPTTGEITVNGTIAALLELGAGFNPELTGRENINFLAPMLGTVPEQSEDFFEDILSFAEIGAFIDQPVKLYSSGMFARLAFAMNIAATPDILIVDEALAVGDVLFQQKCLRRMKEYREHGTIIFVSHDITSVKNLCDQVLWLENGRVREYGSAEEVCHRYFKSYYTETFADDKEIAASVSGLPVKDRQKQNSLPWAGSIQAAMQEIRETQASDFDDKHSFGVGGAKILRCTIDNYTRQSPVFQCGDICRITLYFSCFENISNAIVGFTFKNRLAVPVFGTNTFHYCGRSPCAAGKMYAATFEFTMPDFAEGDYVMTVALTEGTLQNHKVLQWLDDIAILKFESKQRDGCEVGLTCSECTIVEER